MRFTTTILLAIIGLFIASACGGGNDSDVRSDARQSLGVPENSVTTPSTTPSTTIPPANMTPPATAAGGVQHYICPNNCEGSGGAAQVNCPVCGTQYVHNQEYHNQTPTTPSTPNATADQTITPPPTQTGPNAAGQWHYTCPSGCEGGADAQGACANCGTALAHNQAYHN